MPAEPSLTEFPRPNVAVDIAVLTVGPALSGEAADQHLSVVLQRATDSQLSLPGRFIREGRTVEQTVEEVLTQKLGLRPTRVRPDLLEVFSEPGRDPRGWTISIAYAVTLPAHEVSPSVGELAPVDATGKLVSGETLKYDHEQIVCVSVRRMQERYERAPDPDGLLAPPFTMSQLRRVHEIVLGEPLRKDTFNRRMKDRLAEARDRTGGPLIASETVGRPAQMFTYGSPAPAAVPFPLPRTDDPPARGPHRKPRIGD